MAFRHGPFEEMHRFFEQTRRMMVEDGSVAGSGRAEWRGTDTPVDRRGMDTQMNTSVDTTVDVEEMDGGYAVRADLPGFEADDLTIRFEDDVLTIQGETEVADEVGQISHRRSRRIHEQLAFPATVVEDEISATYHNGVLEITLPTEDDDPEDEVHEIDIE